LDINFDLAVKNGRVFTDKGQVSTDLFIKDGRIAALGGAHRAGERIDARGMLILPGAIDVHVHFRDPGPNYKEDWASGSASAAAGGVTTVIDQPNTVPRTMDARSFEEKLDIARHRSLVDFGLNGGPGRIEELKGAGAQAIGEIFSYEHSDSDLAAILTKVNEAGMLASLHAEDGAVIKDKMAELVGRHDAEVYSLARPALAEATAIEKACSWVKRLHICHLSSAVGLAKVEEARRSGRDVTVEVAPHHLFLNTEDYKKQGSYLKINPPLRSREDNDVLWHHLRSGKIDILASDHAPHLPEEKRDDIREAPPGVPGVETMLPLMFFAVKRNLLTLERLVDAISKRPAEIFGFAGKGKIEIGRDADLVVIDSKAVSKINADRLHSRAEWTPFQGREAIFPQMTMIRGRVVYDGDFQVAPGYGRFLGAPLDGPKQKAL
jgi:dihydroorotase